MMFTLGRGKAGLFGYFHLGFKESMKMYNLYIGDQLGTLTLKVCMVGLSLCPDGRDFQNFVLQGYDKVLKGIIWYKKYR